MMPRTLVLLDPGGVAIDVSEPSSTTCTESWSWSPICHLPRTEPWSALVLIECKDQGSHCRTRPELRFSTRCGWFRDTARSPRRQSVTARGHHFDRLGSWTFMCSCESLDQTNDANRQEHSRGLCRGTPSPFTVKVYRCRGQ